jgi:hypothetical protein
MAEKLTKMEAMRRALADLGRDAKPAQLRGWVKEKFGIAMSADHVSTYKGTILRKKSGKRKAAAVTQPSAATNEEPRVRRAPAPRGNGISLDDIAAVKGLVGPVGADGLKELIDVLAR